jgi:hypothetical protein
MATRPSNLIVMSKIPGGGVLSSCPALCRASIKGKTIFDQ